MFNDGLALQLSSADPAINIVAQVFDGTAVLPAVLAHTPDVVLLDINMPRRNGLDCARELIRDFPRAHIIMLTMYAYRKFIDECHAIGVAGYLLKHERAEVIVQSIRRVLAGERVFPPKQATAVHEADFFIRQFKLTPTELKIIGLIRQGLSSQQMANRLFTSFETVRSHRKNIHRKLEISRIAELIEFATEHGL